MPGMIARVLAGLHLTVMLMSPGPSTQRLLSGEWLRFHVVAQDDTAGMQQLKYIVRDAVQDAYRLHCPPDAPGMQSAAEAILPILTDAATHAARTAGFDGPVDVSLGVHAFSARELDQHTIPAGMYPALVIRLGDAQGQNWWGLLDPDMSLRMASYPQDHPEEGICWDWTWQGLLHALLGLPLTEGG